MQEAVVEGHPVAGGATVARERNVKLGDRIVSAGPACLPFAEYYGKTWPCWKVAGDWTPSSGDGRVLMAYTLADYIADHELQAQDGQRGAGGVAQGVAVDDAGGGETARAQRAGRNRLQRAAAKTAV